MVALLNLRLLLQAGSGRTLFAHEPGRDRAHPLNGAAVVLHHLHLLGIELKVALDLEPRASHGHSLGIQHNVSIDTRHLGAELGITHGDGALCALGAHGRHAPAQLADSAVEAVLLIDHPAHIAIRHAGGVFAEAPKRYIREVWVAVWGRAIVQAVRAKPVAAAHACHDGGAVLRHAAGDSQVVRVVVLVVLDHAPVRGLDDRHVHPAAIPDLGQADFLAGGVVPAVFVHGVAARFAPGVL